MSESISLRDFVTFFTIGKTDAEEDTKLVPGWNVELAITMARNMYSRQFIKPYAFRFSSRAWSNVDLCSTVRATGPMNYLGGRMEPLAKLEARDEPEERLLLAKIRERGFGTVVVIQLGSKRLIAPLAGGDAVHREFL